MHIEEGSRNYMNKNTLLLHVVHESIYITFGAINISSSRMPVMDKLPFEAPSKVGCERTSRTTGREAVEESIRTNNTCYVAS